MSLIKNISQLHTLVDRKYFFLYKYFDLEIWHECCYHKEHVVPKKFMVNRQILNRWEGVKVGSNEMVFPHCFPQLHMLVDC